MGEDYMNTEEDQYFNKYRRKSSETKASNEDLSNSKTETEIELTEDLVILRCNNSSVKTTEKSPLRETGLIDEDVNVKERAAIFGGSTTKNNRAKSWTANLITPSNNSKNAMNTNTRPISDTTHVNMSNQSNRKMSPGSPSKIRDMAAFFEQQKKLDFLMINVHVMKAFAPAKNQTFFCPPNQYLFYFYGCDYLFSLSTLIFCIIFDSFFER